MEYFVLYVLVAIATAGAIGGIRDEMEGIGDLFYVIFWPIAISATITIAFLKFVYKIGGLFKK